MSKTIEIVLLPSYLKSVYPESVQCIQGIVCYVVILVAQYSRKCFILNYLPVLIIVKIRIINPA